MPLRAPKMKPFIFGFQRLVWWPKWTPASIISRMVIGASLGEGCASGGEPEPEPPPGGKPEPEGAVVVDSVVVSMLFLCVVFLRLRQQRPKPATTAGTHGRLDRRVVLMGVERAGG